MTDRPGPSGPTEPTDRPDQADRTRCTVCNHECGADINAALRSREQSGESLAKIAMRFQVTESSLKRHARNHPTDPPSDRAIQIAKAATDPAAEEATEAKAPPTEPSARSSPPPLPADPPPPQTSVVVDVVAAEPPPPEASTTTLARVAGNEDTPIAPEPLTPRRGAKCKVCHHPERVAIEQAMAEGVPYTRIEKQFEGISDTGIRRHRDECVPRAILAARLEFLERSNLTTAEAYRPKLEALVHDAQDLVKIAKQLVHDQELTAENVKALATAIKTAESSIVSLGKLLGLFPSGTTVNIINHPHFMVTVNKIIDTICDECLMPVRKVLTENAS